MMGTRDWIEVFGIMATIVALLGAGLCIWANAEFKARRLPDDDGDE